MPFLPLKEVSHVLALRQKNTKRGSSNQNAKKVAEIVEVCHGRLGVERVRDALKKPSRRDCEDDVIDINDEVGLVGSLAKHKERGIRWRGNKTKMIHIVSE